jgi:hypothetical protein
VKWGKAANLPLPYRSGDFGFWILDFGFWIDGAEKKIISKRAKS